MLAQISNANHYRLKDGGIALDLFKHGVDSTSAELSYVPEGIDPVLVELLATARFFSESPDVLRLEKVVAEELKV